MNAPLRSRTAASNDQTSWVDAVRRKERRAPAPPNAQPLASVKLAAALAAIAAATLALPACGSQNASYSLLQSTKTFSQSSAVVNDKLDILWVVDDSGSMLPLQQNLANNFQNFIANFQSKGFDFKMAVTTSQAYLAEPNYRNNPLFAAFRDGNSVDGPTGHPIMTPLTPNLTDVFTKNAKQGASGSGDERIFQSIYSALASPLNAGFIRPTSFFAVVILSDEDDFTDPNRVEGSWFYPGGIADHSYSNPGLVTVDSVVASLDAATGSTPTSRRYNVSAITVLDNACLAAHRAQPNGGASIIGQRYIELANKTNGVLGSLCDPSYATSLSFIQQRIVELATAFKLDRQPVVSSIQVSVNGSAVPQDAANGWTYDSGTNSIVFHGAGVPPAAASIQVAFDPVTIL